jgi:hypothetical protein
VTLRHPNIVRFVEIAWKQHDDLQTLSEYLEMIDLRKASAMTASFSEGVRGAS